MPDLTEIRAAFTEPEEFWSSPLYRRLCAVVAADPFLLGLAASARPGQVPTFAFFGSVHALLLSGTSHPLGDYYTSLHGASARPPDDDAGVALTAFAHEHEAALRKLLETRLVQTNHAQRAVGLRVGLAAIAPHVRGRPAHLLEVGCSAGLVLRHDRYGYRLGDRRAGDPESPVQLVAEWRSSLPAPDLDAIPRLASTTGIDLLPLDPADADDRLWLNALVWPEDRDKADLLHRALAVALDGPLPTIAGDAIDRCPEWAETLPEGEPRIVFHCATRMHVPHERRAAFDAAIDTTGHNGPLYVIAIEGDGLVVTGPGRRPIAEYDVAGHLAWVAPR